MDQKMTNVWRTCNRIRAALFRTKINLWDLFLPYDRSKNGFITEAQFLSVFEGPLQTPIPLTKMEILDLTDFFKIQDGRIYYKQFCEIIHESVPGLTNDTPYVTGLEWEDPLHVNALEPMEMRRLQLLITKMAIYLCKKNILLKPYFQDYELISNNHGAVTLAHFVRILGHLGITVADEEFVILVKRFMKDGYTVNYVAFLQALDEVMDYITKHGFVDAGGDLYDMFHGRVFKAELPRLPRPELATKRMRDWTGQHESFHSYFRPQRELSEDLKTVLRRIQKFVLDNNTDMNQFFMDYDKTKCGRISVNQFQRVITTIGINSMGRLYLHPKEIQQIIDQYKDSVDPNRIYWKAFQDDINLARVVPHLEKNPQIEPELPPEEIKRLPCRGSMPWDSLTVGQRDACEEIMQKLKVKIRNRYINFKPDFIGYDAANRGYVTRNQMRRVFATHNIILTDDEYDALENRYFDCVGFNYQWFIRDLEDNDNIQNDHEKFMERWEKVNTPPPKPKPTKHDKDLVAILAKVKNKIVSERANIIYFMKPYDPFNTSVMRRSLFEKALYQLKLGLNQHEIETIMESFSSPLRPDYVDYKRFIDVVEKAVTTLGLERAPLLLPVQFVPCYDSHRNFLNFAERQTVQSVLSRLGENEERIYNLLDIFKAYDRHNLGTITPNQVMRAFSTRGLHNVIKTDEWEALCKCFNCSKDCLPAVDYKALCRAIDYVFKSKQRY